ncbi:hypothetical protein D3C72_878860 [compost metagenome]
MASTFRALRMSVLAIEVVTPRWVDPSARCVRFPLPAGILEPSSTRKAPFISAYSAGSRV